MKRASMLLGVLLLALLAIGLTACSRNSEGNVSGTNNSVTGSEAANHPVNELFRLCKEDKFSEAAGFMMYIGDDLSRSSKDVYDYANAQEKNYVDSLCRSLKAKAAYRYTVGELRETASGPNAGIFTSEVTFQLPSEEKKQYFDFRKFKDRYALIDIDDQPPMSKPGVTPNQASDPTVADPDVPRTTPRIPVPQDGTIKGGVLNGRAISLPKPPYPPQARAAGASGTVNVEVIIDQTGKVTSASANGGHPLLQQAAVKAAYEARFKPTILEGQPVKVSGVITYNFVNE